MRIREYVSGRYRQLSGWKLVALLSLIMWGTAVAHAQDSSNPQSLPVQTPKIPTEQLRRAPGVLLAEGTNTIPIGELKVKTYRLEEVKLPQPAEFGREEKGGRSNSVLRLTITLDSYINGAYTIWVGDEALTGVHTKENELSALIFDRGILEDGASISVSRGTGCNTDSLSTLPEKLYVPSNLRSSRPPDTGLGNRVKRIRSVPSVSVQRNKANVEIELFSALKFPVNNQGLVLQIGHQEIAIDPYQSADGRTLSFTLTAEQFARLENNAPIKVKSGLCSPGGVYFGRLNKSLLDK